MALHSFWTEERDTIIRTVAANGGTAKEAWLACGAISRNAVIGRSRRLGFNFGQGLNETPQPVTRLQMPSKPRALTAVHWPKPAPTKKWTDGEIETLRTMAAATKSAAEIATAVGRTEHAVQSKASDLKIRIHRQTMALPPRPVGRPGKGVPVVFCDGGKVALVDLERHHCRYIPGDPKAGGPIYCGDRREPGSSFCPAHHALCYVPVVVRRVAA